VFEGTTGHPATPNAKAYFEGRLNADALI